MVTQRESTSEPEDERSPIAIVRDVDGEEVVEYFRDEAEADATVTAEDIADALSLAGVWSDLDWDELEAALHEIRHANKPTPLFEG